MFCALRRDRFFLFSYQDHHMLVLALAGDAPLRALREGLQERTLELLRQTVARALDKEDFDAAETAIEGAEASPVPLALFSALSAHRARCSPSHRGYTDDHPRPQNSGIGCGTRHEPGYARAPPRAAP